MAVGRIKDFQTVHDGKEDHDEAFTILRESLGIDLETLATTQELTEEVLPSTTGDYNFMSGVLFGLIVGLIASDYASET